MTIAFLGDISFNGTYSLLYSQGIDPFREMREELKSYDFVIGNLECLSEGDCGENLLKNPRLKTSNDTLRYLSNIGVNIVELANNHVYDNLRDGFEKTTNQLDNLNILHLGAATNIEDASKPIVLKKDGISVYLLNYVNKDTNPNLPNDATVYPNWYNENHILEDISRYRKDADYIILLFHWGGKYEGGMYPDWDQIKDAHSFIDAGADLIIGNHSHTIQPFELYNDRYIYYSLGNFCFFPLDRDIKDEAPRYKKSRIVQVTLESESIDIKSSYSAINCDCSLSICHYNSLFQQALFSIIKSHYFFWLFYRFFYFNVRPLIIAFQYKIPFFTIINKVRKKLLQH